MKYIDNEGNECEGVGCCLKCNEDTIHDNILCLNCMYIAEMQEIEDREFERDYVENMKKKENMKKGKK